MASMDYEAWRCRHDDKLFCPDEGCPKWYGCARDHGWLPGQPSLRECQGLRPLTEAGRAALRDGGENG